MQSNRFKIETPIGSYNPNWAMYLPRDVEEKLHFVLETKDRTSLMELRTSGAVEDSLWKEALRGAGKQCGDADRKKLGQV